MARAKEKASTDDYRALDVRSLHRAGALSPGRVCTLSWKSRGVVVASIDVHAESPASVRLRYQAKTAGQLEQKDYRVSIVWTPCHLGGERAWFLCPCCSRRVAKLFGGAVFACRHCWNLNYASQQASKRDRASDRSWTLRQALGCDHGFMCLPAEYIQKPKGMHWRTFEKKLEQIKQVDGRALAEVSAVIDSIERRAGDALSRLIN